MRYLIELRPIGSYAFSGESSLNNPGRSATRRTSYVVGCERMPPQTTVLGTVRRAILEWAGCLRADMRYTPEEKAKLNVLIGSAGFSFHTTPEAFGALKSISGVFISLRLMDDEKQQNWFFPAPADLAQGAACYEAMPWKNATALSENACALPAYDVKTGLRDSFVCIPWHFDRPLPADGVERLVSKYAPGAPVVDASCIFHDNEYTAVRKNENCADDERSFRIQHRCHLTTPDAKFGVKPSFAVVAEIDAPDSLHRGMERPLLVPMGARDGLFEVTARPLTVEASPTPADPCMNSRIAALSPVLLPPDWRKKVTFATVYRQKVRHMIASGYGSAAYQHDRTLQYFAAPGSVFYFNDQTNAAEFRQVIHAQKIRVAGFSQIVEL